MSNSDIEKNAWIQKLNNAIQLQDNANKRDLQLRVEKISYENLENKLIDANKQISKLTIASDQIRVRDAKTTKINLENQNKIIELNRYIKYQIEKSKSQGERITTLESSMKDKEFIVEILKKENEQLKSLNMIDN